MKSEPPRWPTNAPAVAVLAGQLEHALGQRAHAVLGAGEADRVGVAIEAEQVDVQHRRRRAGLEQIVEVLVDRPRARQIGGRVALALALGRADQRLGPGGELAQVERLGHVRVGAGLEALDLLLDRRQRGQHQDRRARPHHVALQPPRDLDAVDPRHHPVEHEQIGIVGAHQPQRLLPVVRAQAQEAGVAQRHAHHVSDGVVVLGDDDLLEHCQGDTPAARPRQPAVRPLPARPGWGIPPVPCAPPSIPSSRPPPWATACG
jgi:hypothetical protein